MKTTILFFCTLLLLYANIASGGILKGMVSDEQGNPLPYATIYLEGTTSGTNANGNGLYELSVDAGLHRVICQYVGYKQIGFTVSFTGNETIEHNFQLKGEAQEMTEVVVHANAEDPAYGIIRKAIERRNFHLDQIKTFQTSIYMKVGMRSRTIPKKLMGQKINPSDVGADTTGKGVLYLFEEDADYYAKDGETRTVVHSVHTSGNPGGLGFAQMPPVITFYNNLVDVLGARSRGFISPINDRALSYYNYKLAGEFQDKGHTIYKIEVKQKRAFEPCFNGTIYIVDSDFAIHSLNLTLTKESGIDLFDTLKIDQLYLPLKADTWVIKSQVTYFSINLFGFDVNGNLVNVYNNQKINTGIADSVFSGNIVSAYDKTANKKDSSYWTANRPIPLETDEKRDFVKKDSIRIVEENPVRLDSIRRRRNKLHIFGPMLAGYSYSSKENKNTYSINPVLLGLVTDNIINFNPVDGFNLTAKLNWKHVVDSNNYWTTDIASRYGFANTHFNTIARFTWKADDKAWKGRGWTTGVEAGKYVFQYNPDRPVLPWFNTYATLFYRENDLRLYERMDGAAFVRRDYGNGLSWLVKTSFQRRYRLNNSTEYSFFREPGEFYKTNTPVHLLAISSPWEDHNALIFYSSVSYKPGYTYTQYPDYKIANRSSWPTFTLTYEKGVPGVFESKPDFNKLRFSIRDDVQLHLLGYLSYNLAVGGCFGNNYMAIPDLIHLYGNRGIGYAAPYLQSFQFAQYYDFSNSTSKYMEGHIEYHMNGLLSNKIPLLKQARWNLLYGGSAFYANDNLFYAEAFVGLDNIGWKLLRILRVDFVQSWDSYKGHNSGIRFGISGKNVSITSSNPTHNEW